MSRITKDTTIGEAIQIDAGIVIVGGRGGNVCFLLVFDGKSRPVSGKLQSDTEFGTARHFML